MLYPLFQWYGVGNGMLILFTGICAGETIREMARCPYLIGAALGVVFFFILITAQNAPEKYAVLCTLFAFLSVLGMSVTREVLRMVYLGKFNYSIYTYKLNISLGSTALFLLTFIMGIIVMVYPLAVAWKLGRYGATNGEGV